MKLRISLIIFLAPIFLALLFAYYFKEYKKSELESLVDSGVVALMENGKVTRDDIKEYFRNPPTGDSSILRGLEMTSEDLMGIDTEDPAWFDEPAGQMLLSKIIKHIALIKSIEQHTHEELDNRIDQEVLEYQESLMTNTMEEELDEIKPTVTQEEMVAYYVDNADEFHQQGLRFARHIMLEKNFNSEHDEQTHHTPEAHISPADIQARLLNGEDFHHLVRNSQSESIHNDGLLGWISKGTLAEEFEQALWALNVGEITGPIEISNQFHFIQLLDAQIEGLIPLKEAIPSIREKLQENKRILNRYRLLGLPIQSIFSRNAQHLEIYRRALLDAAYARGIDQQESIVNQTQTFYKYRRADVYFSNYVQVLKNTIEFSESQEASIFIENEAIKRLLDNYKFQMLVKLNLGHRS